MAITKMTGRTHDMLAKDKRVFGIEKGTGDTVIVVLNREWMGPTDRQGEQFDNWEAARNWVRKSVQLEVTK